MQRVVLDTNVWLDWLVFADPGVAALRDAVAGGTAEIWIDDACEAELERVLDTHPNITWVQLPWAGVERFAHLFDTRRTWTSAKGVFGPAVAELALGMLLGGMRHIVAYSRLSHWSEDHGVNLVGARVVIVGAEVPGFGDRRKAMLQDMAVLTGGTVISEEIGLKLDTATVDLLGRARRVVVTKDATTIMQLIRDNLTLWTSELEEEGDK